MRTAKPWSLPTQPASRSTLRAIGVTGEMLTTALRRRRLVRVRRGVYLAAEAWPDDPAERHLIRARAELAVDPDAVISRQSAAIVWGLPCPGNVPWHDLPASVSLPAGGGRRARSNGTTHHVEQLPASHLSRDPDGYAVTGPARTAVDLAAGLPVPEALVILDAAARLLCDSFVTTPRRSDYARPVLAGAARDLLTDMAQFRRVTRLLPGIGLADPRRESAAESLSAGHFHLAGLPSPECQAPVRTAEGRFYPDFLWPEHGVIGECDGAVKYASDPDAIVREKLREQALRDAGFLVVRWLAVEIMTRPGVVVERVERALAGTARSASG
ncbi:hypothetical protein [Propionicicella superfundia]|uniref:hypothetical protein n=1 Tax=Propionicicella superfundia TaxID=348582 RepID=UPI0004028FEF|nr:hypothetical protein [Propionicicella superfundia]